jgi:MFS-type transporter involved in bile tolerance (Atg22 family)
MDITLIVAIVSLLLNILFVPLFIWIWTTDRKVVQLNSTQITKEDIEKLYNELKDIKDNFVHVRTCDSRHKI